MLVLVEVDLMVYCISEWKFCNAILSLKNEYHIFTKLLSLIIHFKILGGVNQCYLRRVRLIRKEPLLHSYKRSANIYISTPVGERCSCHSAHWSRKIPYIPSDHLCCCRKRNEDCNCCHNPSKSYILYSQAIFCEGNITKCMISWIWAIVVFYFEFCFVASIKCQKISQI